MKCAREECNNEANKLTCPECIKSAQSHGLKDNLNSKFCSKECFQLAWPVHKLCHPVNLYVGFPFTGTLRPFAQSPTRALPPHINLPEYALTGVPVSEDTIRGSSHLSILSTPEDINAMRTVCKLAREVLDEAGRAVRPGITTDQIDALVHAACIARGAYPSPLNYRGFPKSVCTSVNEVICHGIPDGRPLQDGDIVNIDVTLYYQGFHGDLNETFTVGNVDADALRLIACTRRCLDKAIAACGPGVRYRDMGAIIECEAKKDGFTVNRTYCGHGINKMFHCPPTVPHYASNKAIGIMRPGHVFTIEPMLCEGQCRDVHWPDNWTAVTADGKRSAQFEQTLLITESGVEILTK